MISYDQWKEILRGRRLPSVVVDLAAFDRNVAQAAQIARTHGKTIRLATKSVRVPDLIVRAVKSDPVFKGLMCFAVEEAQYLHQSHGLDDFLIAYPTLQECDLKILRRMHDQGARVTIVTDHPEGVRALARTMQGVSQPFRVLMDVDVSLRLLGGLLHLGVRRSRVRTVGDALQLADKIASYPQLKLVGLMAYEAQVAGLGDRNPFKKLINPFAALIRRLSIGSVFRLRAQIVEALKARGLEMEVVNGAGTGSLNFAAKEGALTEITLGSGFLCSHLFDYYSNIRFEPACFFALQVTRASDSSYVTCLGGGYIASGEPGWDRVPVPYQPEGLRLVSMEGCGEVQTPLTLPPGLQLELGSPVLFRHAKAGELAERFDEYLLVENGKVTAHARTYRGAQQCFI